jgi:hypothetical protein
VSAAKPPLLVVELSWDEGGLPRTEMFGPWQPVDDASHMAAIWEFMEDWRRVTGCVPQRAVMSALASPEHWIRERASKSTPGGGS